jgi:hypothetical protein
MSIDVSTLVWKHSKQKGSALLVLLAIADNCHDDGAGAYPSYQTLAAKSRLSERNVKYIIKTLEASKELIVLRGMGPGGCNRYTIDLSVWGVQTLQPPCNPARPDDPPLHRGGASQRKKGVQPVAPITIHEPSIESSEEPIWNDKKPRPKNGRAHDPLYVAFCEQYESAYQVPYICKAGDFVQLANLKAQWHAILTPDLWLQMLTNYFASTVNNHTVAHLVSVAAKLKAGRVDKFGGLLSTDNGRKSPAEEKVERILQAADRFVQRHSQK